MSTEALLTNIVPFAGSGLLGYAMGFALKKILKWMLIERSFNVERAVKNWLIKY